MKDGSRWPIGMSSDARLVSSLCLPTAPCHVRVLLPPLTDEAGPHWRSLAERAGLAIDERVRFGDLADALGDGLASLSPNGQVSSATAGRLVQAIIESTSGSDVKLVLWDVYAEQEKWREVSPSRIELDRRGPRWADGAHLLSRAVSVHAIQDFTFEQGRRFPVAIIPTARDYLIAGTGYGDSLYVSGSTALCAALGRAGLEFLAISAGGRLPT